MDYANILTAIPLEFTPQDDIVLLEPYHYLGKNPGKEIRSQLIEAFNYWLDVKKEDLEVIQNVVGYVISLSLSVGVVAWSRTELVDRAGQTPDGVHA